MDFTFKLSSIYTLAKWQWDLKAKCFCHIATLQNLYIHKSSWSTYWSFCCNLFRLNIQLIISELAFHENLQINCSKFVIFFWSKKIQNSFFFMFNFKRNILDLLQCGLFQIYRKFVLFFWSFSPSSKSEIVHVKTVAKFGPNLLAQCFVNHRRCSL